MHRLLLASCLAIGLIQAAHAAPAEKPSDAKATHASPWDGRYILQSATGGDLCPSVVVMPLVVSGGTFSFPWRLQVSTLVKVGTIDGVIARNGKVSTTVKLDHPYPDAVASLSPQELDKVKTVPIAFSGTKHHTAKLTLEHGAKLRCSVVWESDDRTATAPSPPSPPPKQTTPTRPAPSSPPPERSRPARSEPSPPPPPPSSPPPPPRDEHRHSDCVSKCWTTEDIGKRRCEEDESTCHSRCERDNPVQVECLSKCSSDEDTCKDRYSQDGQSCVFGCPND